MPHLLLTDFTRTAVPSDVVVASHLDGLLLTTLAVDGRVPDAVRDRVEPPALVHTDLWPGNLFVDPGTLALTGVIDPERAVWGDPLLELAGADQTGRGPVPAALLAGYTQAGGVLARHPVGGARLLLYRMTMSLAMLVEMAPRGYSGPRRGRAPGDLRRQPPRRPGRPRVTRAAVSACAGGHARRD
jgi:hypothetical protein